MDDPFTDDAINPYDTMGDDTSAIHPYDDVSASFINVTLEEPTAKVVRTPSSSPTKLQSPRSQEPTSSPTKLQSSSSSSSSATSLSVPDKNVSFEDQSESDSHTAPVEVEVHSRNPSVSGLDLGDLPKMEDKNDFRKISV